MSLIGITRVLNEDDIVEAFVRHHATMVDHHLIMDNGSTDETVAILRALKDEGLNISVFQNRSAFFTESSHNTVLFRHAANVLSGDWAIFLDTDEFVNLAQAPEGLSAALDAVPPEALCVGLPNLTYFDSPRDDPAEPIVPVRMRWRENPPQRLLSKIFARTSLVAANAVIDAGQHEVLFEGKPIASHGDHRLSLGHYYRRSAWQTISKSVLGYLKVAAAPKSERDKNRSVHYNDIFRFMRDDPQRLFEPGFLTPTYDDMNPVEDPLPYLGGPLRYTGITDPRFKAIRVLAALAEQLAQAHAHFIDTNEGVRLQAVQSTYVWEQLF
jgi:glycosyltransferase involved in cell wall biosynthesis